MKDKTALALATKACALSLPILLWCAFTLVLAYRSGELGSFDRVINQQAAGRDLLYGLAFSDPVVPYKFAAVQKRHPKILALGSSRVMQFRAVFFRDPSSFYNAGGAVQHLEDYNHFLSHLPASTLPEILIISLDQDFFNDAWRSEEIFDAEAYDNSLQHPPSASSVFQTASSGATVAKLISRKINPGKWLFKDNPHAVGIMALERGDGFRDDGSYSYEYQITHQGPVHGDIDIFSRIEQGNQRFQYGDQVSGTSLLELARLLDFCSQHHIHIIGIVPPFMPSVIARMKQKGSKYAYVWKLPVEADLLFKAHQASVFDFTNMAQYGSQDTEYIDGQHGSELTYAKITEEIAHQDPVLRERVDEQWLADWIKHPYSDLLLQQPTTALGTGQR
jgi:hypothetical protein